ncbi:hypothetical protein ACFWJY_33955, partial [Streptomyces anulatus]|uniref:hypothetical protein n=1 Tax=Streptomyces anulatus TaxID=1892 RepID=UPI003660D7E5
MRAFGRSLRADAPVHVVVAYGTEASLAGPRRPAPARPASSGGAVDGNLQEQTEELLTGIIAEVLRHAPE